MPCYPAKVPSGGANDFAALALFWPSGYLREPRLPFAVLSRSCHIAITVLSLCRLGEAMPAHRYSVYDISATCSST